MIRAVGVVILWSRLSSLLARLQFPRVPKLPPSIKIVSKTPNEAPTCVTDITLLCRNPLLRETWIAPGETSIPKTLQPCS